MPAVFVAADAPGARPLLWCLRNHAGNLAVNNADNQAASSGSGAIPPLVALLGSGTAGGKEAAARVLQKLTANAGNAMAIANAGATPALVALLGGGTVSGK